MRKFLLDREKSKSLAHYILRRVGAADGMLIAELGKAMWLADARSFALRGQPITGAIYQREASSSAPRPDGLDALLGEMNRLAEIVLAQDRIAAGPNAGLPPISVAADELDAIEWAIGHLGDPCCERIWQIAENGEEIPYHAILALRMRDPDNEELEWAKRRASELAALR
jgi:hypothetical protein